MMTNYFKTSVFLLITILLNSCTINQDEISDTILKNGDFEKGKEDWIFFSNRGTVEIDNELSYGKGSSSVKIVAKCVSKSLIVALMPLSGLNFPSIKSLNVWPFGLIYFPSWITNSSE